MATNHNKNQDEHRGSSQIASILHHYKQALIQRWARLVLDDPGVPEADRPSEPELIDPIPSLLD
ncbi:RsbRD N-terminal domain-containing protein [Sorangium atrum]|uniref:RsbRD N-terminal domain-containing protein n=1 Tax=Sorangium atrum TaxID=2995308 RepID=A0ABT5CGX3_9BACT|nr:RsbRD N-terminal domain-containing protein [Sorangium aterium]MDC0685075.1 RsbRD N-terminal domain-containing protein [Sorangium aterium]